MQLQRKGSSSGACGNTGKGARPKQKNNANVNAQSQAQGRGVPWNCSVCENAVDEDEQAIECHVCKLWSHKLCTNLSDAEYRVLERGGESLLWQCNNCIREGAASNAQAS